MLWCRTVKFIHWLITPHRLRTNTFGHCVSAHLCLLLWMNHISFFHFLHLFSFLSFFCRFHFGVVTQIFNLFTRTNWYPIIIWWMEKWFALLFPLRTAWFRLLCTKFFQTAMLNKLRISPIYLYATNICWDIVMNSSLFDWCGECYFLFCRTRISSIVCLHSIFGILSFRCEILNVYFKNHFEI